MVGSTKRFAQIEFSANCNNPAIFLCFPPPDGFGLGGIWLWIEIDANQTGDVAGAGAGTFGASVGVPDRSGAM